MRAHSFRYLCGLTVLATHVTTIFLITIATRFTDIRDQIGSILIVAPITLIYATAFVRYVTHNMNAAPVSPVTGELDSLAAFTMYLIILIFCSSLVFVVVNFVYLSSYQVNEFKMWLGASETAFGALTGIVFERLFGTSSYRRSRKRSYGAG